MNYAGTSDLGPLARVRMRNCMAHIIAPHLVFKSGVGGVLLSVEARCG